MSVQSQGLNLLIATAQCDSGVEAFLFAEPENDLLYSESLLHDDSLGSTLTSDSMAEF